MVGPATVGGYRVDRVRLRDSRWSWTVGGLSCRCGGFGELHRPGRVEVELSRPLMLGSLGRWRIGEWISGD